MLDTVEHNLDRFVPHKVGKSFYHTSIRYGVGARATDWKNINIVGG